jgi:hypothetical protein
MIISRSVRDEMEDFHVAQLSQEKMKELNPLIRNAVYNALFAISYSDRIPACAQEISMLALTVPDYWEPPELMMAYQREIGEQQDNDSFKFKSAFLNEQFKIGSIFFNHRTWCIELKGSYEFKGEFKDAHALRDKITSLLRKESYEYVASLCGYIKRERNK